MYNDRLRIAVSEIEKRKQDEVGKAIQKTTDDAHKNDTIKCEEEERTRDCRTK